MGNPIRRFDSNDRPLPIGTPATPVDPARPPTPNTMTDQSSLPPMPRTPTISPHRSNELNFLPAPTPLTTITINHRRTPENFAHLLHDIFILTPLAPISASPLPPRRGVVLVRQGQGTPAVLLNMVMGSEDNDGGVSLVPCEVCGELCFDGRCHCVRQ